MHAKGSNLGSTCIQTPRSSSLFYPDLPQREGFAFNPQYVSSQVGLSTDWRKHHEISYWRRFIRENISAILRSPAHHTQAQSSYVIADILAYKLLMHAPSKEEYINQETLLQRVKTQVNQMRREKGSQQQIVQKNEPRAFHTAAMGNLQSESSNLMIPQHVSRVNPEVSHFFPGLSSNSCLGNRRQCQPQPMHSPQSFEQFIQPNELCGKSSTGQTGSCYGDQDESCGQVSGKKTLKRTWLSTRPVNGDDESSDEQRLLPAYPAMLRPDKILKMQSECCFPFINTASSDQWVPKMSQSYSFGEGLPELQQQTSFSSIFSDVAQCHVEPIANPWLDSKNNVIDDDTFGQAFKNENIEHKWSDPIAADIEDIHDKTGVWDCTSERLENPMHDSMQICEVIDNTIDDRFEQTFKSATIHSKSLEAGRMPEESDPRNHVDVNSSNLEKTVFCEDAIAVEVDDINARTGVADCIVEQCKYPMLDSTSISENNIIDDTFGKAFESEAIHSKGSEADNVSMESEPKDHDPTESSNSKDTEISLSSSTHSLSDVPIAEDVEDISGGIGFNLAGINAEKKVSESKADEKKEAMFSKATANIVSLTELFTSDQIREHISSLRKHPVQSMPEEETRKDANKCQLCDMEKLFFAPVPICCSCCGKLIKLKANYYRKRAENFYAQNCFCTVCYKKSRGEHITFNAISVPKALVDMKINDEVLEEGWVQCNKCEQWQHEICALYNRKRDLDNCAEYICPICRLNEIEEGMHVSLPKMATFGAKDLPNTMLGDHIEKRLFERLMQERVDREKVEGTKNIDEVLAADNLSVKVVLSVDKQLEVKKQFLNIFPEQSYPSEFSYTSKVILLFQKIDGADVCLFAMYVQEFGSECGNPNQRCVYISYLDSVKYFRPEIKTKMGEALRTLVYHEILIGYLDFCKKRGFTTCYIWVCPPNKGVDYILYCHPDTQKIPKNDKLRQWYLSMLTKAAEENIVVGLSNIYDHFFVPTEKCDSKVTASRLPYFDGDFWSSRAMEVAGIVEKGSGGEYEKALNKQLSKRALKALGHVNPSKDTAKDILVMHKLGPDILHHKEEFIIVHLQHTCVHCQEVIVSGKRWFCTKCKKFQECERCHTADSHTSISGEKHTLSEVLIEDTKENDIILDNQIFENRLCFLSFCHKNQLQFDSLRRAKYSTMMMLHHLKHSSICSICGDEHEFQHSWSCESCPKFSACSACYKKGGADCHAHKLSQTSTSVSVSVSKNESSPEIEESKKKSTTLSPTEMMEVLEVLQHACQCNYSNKTQPCSYPNCLKMKKLLYHARKCTNHARKCTTPNDEGCEPCTKVRMVLHAHSKICEVSNCRIPCCTELKKRRESQDGATVKSKQRT